MQTTLRKPNKAEIKEIRQVAKDHGIKGCKMHLRSVIVGTQCERLLQDTAKSFIKAIEDKGFYIADMFKEAADLDLADTFLVEKVVTNN